MDEEEVLFILFREDLRNFIDKWEMLFEKFGYLNVPTTSANALLSIEDVFKRINYEIKNERK